MFAALWVREEEARSPVARPGEGAFEEWSLLGPVAQDLEPLPRFRVERAGADASPGRHCVEGDQLRGLEALAFQHPAPDSFDHLHIAHHHAGSERGVSVEAERVSNLVERRAEESSRLHRHEFADHIQLAAAQPHGRALEPSASPRIEATAREGQRGAAAQSGVSLLREHERDVGALRRFAEGKLDPETGT